MDSILHKCAISTSNLHDMYEKGTKNFLYGR